MGAFDEINNLPISSAAYNSWANGWVFGADSSGETCGAMPFRRGTGKYSERCLRGEDWAYLCSLCSYYRGIPSASVWSGIASAIPSTPTFPTSLLRRSQSEMYDWLKAVETASCFGEDFDMSNSAVEVVESDIYAEAANHLTELVQIESSPVSQTGELSLSLSRMKTFFKDVKKLKCTVTDNVGYTWGGSGGRNDIYEYYKASSSSPAEIRTRDMISAYMTSPVSSQKVGSDCMALIPVQLYESSGGVSKNAYALVAAGGKFQITNSAQNPATMSATINISGQSIASLAADATGINLTPSPISTYPGEAAVSLHGTVLTAIWPKWLIDYDE